MVAAVNDALGAIVTSLRLVGFEATVTFHRYYNYLVVNGVRFYVAGRGRTMWVGQEAFTRPARRAFDVEPMIAHVISAVARAKKRESDVELVDQLKATIELHYAQCFTRKDLSYVVNDDATVTFQVKLKDPGMLTPLLDFVQELKAEDD